MRQLLYAGSALAWAITPLAAHAQDPAPQSVSLEEVVVTAQRREENLQKAALAVSAVAGDALTRASVTQATDLTRLVPAIQVAPAASFTQIYLRGVGTFGPTPLPSRAWPSTWTASTCRALPRRPACSTISNGSRC
jgi:iron complex outermembrane receptor protein